MKRLCLAALAAALVSGSAVLPASAASAVESWVSSAPVPVAGPSTLVPSSGFAVFPVHRLRSAANRFSSPVSDVDIRGLRPDGRWTEWTPLPATLSVATSSVQVRAGRVDASQVPVSATFVPVPPVSRDASAVSYRIFATREGLVGGHTASGHVIVTGDHFVALPSRRGLSTKDSGEYTVRVCADNGRCEWAPVWDVGPWNTKDDYWNAPDVRQMWQDLPRGKPQSQAAKQDGYNGGRDQFGRVVKNPAGIDLADGMFWDGLALKGNSWVSVTFVWTGPGGPSGTVNAGEPLNVRSAPAVDAPVVGLAANLATVPVECTQADWYRVASGMWVASAYLSGVSNAPPC